MRLLALVMLCAGCGRSAISDVALTAPSVCGVERSSWSWSAPALVAELTGVFATIQTNPSTNIFDPILSENGLTLYITADLLGQFEVFTLTRPSLSEPFDHIELGPSDVNQTGVTAFGFQPLDSLNIALTFGDFPVPGIAAGTPVIVMANTAEPPHTWKPIQIDFVRSGLEDPRFTGDGTGLVFASVTDTTAPLRGVFFSERASVADDFSTLAQFDGLSANDDSAPWISTDRRTMLFAHADTGANTAQDSSDIWVATRATADAPFASVGPLDVLNSPYFDGEPYIFEGGGVCELYMVANLPAKPGFWLYRSVMQ